MKTIYIDGKYLKVKEEIIDLFTPGKFKAHGVFETMLGLDGVVLGLELHLKRLTQGVKALRLKVPAIDHSILKKLLKVNKLACARVRLMVWQGAQVQHLLIASLPYEFPTKKTYRVCIIKTSRAAHSKLAHVKSLDYELFANAFAQARAQGFDEALLLNAKGYIFEASRANIFWVKDGVLYTPPLSSGCLNGLMRQQVMAQAQAMKIPVKEKNLTLKILKSADTAFLTNSLLGLKPFVVGKN